MTFRQALKLSSLCCFTGMVVGGYIAALVWELTIGWSHPASLLDWLKFPVGALLILPFAAGFAVIPLVVIAWPAYAWLIYKEKASYTSALIIAVLSFLAAWPFLGMELAPTIAVFSICIALATHSSLPRQGSGSASTVYGKL